MFNLSNKVTQTFVLLMLSIFYVSCGPSGSNGNEIQPTPESVLPQLIHPKFNLSLEDLETLLIQIQTKDERTITPGIFQAILNQPQVFLHYIDQMTQWPQDTFLLADKENFLPSNYSPPDLVNLNRYMTTNTGHPFLTLNRAGLELRRVVMPDLLAMIEAARMDGIVLDISSTYRSYNRQVEVFAFWIDRLGEEEARRVSAEPGSSQHQLGTAIDFGSITPAFADHPAGRWLARRAWEFGWSLSYPSGFEWLTGYAFEPWHFRWIGRTATALEQQFFEGSQFRMLLFWDLGIDLFLQAR
jgi:D-alanyl-D-alanine carboxypeptidase